MLQNEFWAKSGNKETIMSHTEKLLEEYERLEALYPSLKKNEKLWEMLKVVCIYHDFGKMNKKFQKRVKSNIKGLLDGEIHHAVLSMGCLPLCKMEECFGEENLEEIYKAILFHHHRKDLIPENKNMIFEEIERMSEDYFSLVQVIKDRKNEFPRLYKGFSKYVSDFQDEELIFEDFYLSAYPNDILNKEEKISQRAIIYIFLKGFLNRIDYAASAGISVENKNDFLENGLKTFLKNLNAERVLRGKEKTDWNALQRYMMKNKNENVIVVAQTGMGKTEAALWWIGNNKGFFTLPLRTAINSVYDRIKKKILKNQDIDNRIGLLHSENFEYYVNIKEKENIFDLQNYYMKTKQLSLPLTITTLDQLFLFVFRYIGYEERLATMAYSKVVVDEVQMYGADLTAFLIIGLEMIQKMGGKFAILTATFPGFIKDLMKDRGIKLKEPIAKFIDKELIRHSVMRKYEEINGKFIFEEYRKDRKKKILVICNTVRKCQKIYRELIAYMEEDINTLHMLHAKYIRRDRRKLEEEIFEFTKENSDLEGIWITSSIAEASLDIDFDLLITELSDINSLFQRFGRCFRRRVWYGIGYNCVVFDGGNQYCSGVGEDMPISEEIFLMSRLKLVNRFPENEVFLLDEETKLKMVEELYSTENIQKYAPKYYAEVLGMMEKPSLYSPNENNKGEAQKKFRNIVSYTIIPLPVFSKYEREIRNMELELKEKNLSYEKKVIIRQKLREFTVDVDAWTYQENDYKNSVQIGSNEEIKIMNCNYDSFIGLEQIENKGEGIFI